MSANDRQECGDHYRRDGKVSQQHWDRVVELFGWPGARAYFVGCCTKYLERYWLKGGIKDLAKAAHYLEKLRELEDAHVQKMANLPDTTVPFPPPYPPGGHCVVTDGWGNPPKECVDPKEYE